MSTLVVCYKWKTTLLKLFGVICGIRSTYLNLVLTTVTMEETNRLTQATQTTLARGERVGEVRYAIYTMTYCTTCKSEGRLVVVSLEQC